MTALRLLLFRAGGQVFAVEAGAVREILPSSSPTRIPGAPGAVEGLINVRGMLVTVVDAAQAIGGMAATDEARSGSIILVETGARPAGLAVDEVLDLVSVSSEALEEGVSLPGVRPDLVRAVGTAGGHSFVLLATDVLLDPLLP